MTGNALNWRQKAISALVVVLLIAGVTRVAYELLVPLIPYVVVLLILLTLCWLALGLRR